MPSCPKIDKIISLSVDEATSEDLCSVRSSITDRHRKKLDEVTKESRPDTEAGAHGFLPAINLGPTQVLTESSGSLVCCQLSSLCLNWTLLV